MSRLTRSQILMESAHLWARRSTCERNRVGASVVIDGRVLMSGYNGAPPGMPHCEHRCSCLKGEAIKKYVHNLAHVPGCTYNDPCIVSAHAEQNAINSCARYGVATQGAEMYITLSPCRSCAMSIITAGIIAVTYFEQYRDISGVELLQGGGLVVEQYSELSTRTSGS